ncbi:hypothetical protein U875_15365 [Pandoraea pnomenusa 3kgm]|nr:hypothetical protein U875_15365 [Pandoraea pnomenusa 3kgm]AHB78671.1 hypothetical protein X636_19430 [Pandoraea pnomenusa]AHN77367.1 hypothetical protein DA70_07245 [Pandoraea pnomenusa]ANC46100.1 hypothetical protein A6P55_19905 [Pandoraea pnomenusa]
MATADGNVATVAARAGSVDATDVRTGEGEPLVGRDENTDMRRLLGDWQRIVPVASLGNGGLHAVASRA